MYVRRVHSRCEYDSQPQIRVEWKGAKQREGEMDKMERTGRKLSHVFAGEGVERAAQLELRG
jgi:hypothetical protein